MTDSPAAIAAGFALPSMGVVLWPAAFGSPSHHLPGPETAVFGG
jgi:hypothetical protein